MRLFIAVEFDNSVKEKLYSLGQEIKRSGIDGNFTLKENIHLTVRFIGEQKSDEHIKYAVRSAASKMHPFEIRICGIGAFKNGILYARIRENPELYKLYKNVGAELEKVGIKNEIRPYTPHITLARQIGPEKTNFEIPEISYSVRSISLMESTRVDGILVYLCRYRGVFGG